MSQPACHLFFPESAANCPVVWRDSGEAGCALNKQNSSPKGYIFIDFRFPRVQEQEHHKDLNLLTLAGRPSHVSCGHQSPGVSGLQGAFNFSVPGMYSQNYPKCGFAMPWLRKALAALLWVHQSSPEPGAAQVSSQAGHHWAPPCCG